MVGWEYMVSFGVQKVSEFWRVVGGMQQLVARDGGSAGHVGGGDGGTDRGAVLGSGGAKEVAQPGGDLAVGRRTAMFLMWGGMGWANVGGVSTSMVGIVVCVLGRGFG